MSCVGTQSIQALDYAKCKVQYIMCYVPCIVDKRESLIKKTKLFLFQAVKDSLSELWD